MSVWLARAAKSVQTSMVPTSATAGRATTSGRTGTPVTVGNIPQIPDLYQAWFWMQLQVNYTRYLSALLTRH